MDKHEYFRKKIEALPDSSSRIFQRPPLPEQPQTFHIIGICGTAMGALAGLLVEKGYRVSGSDTSCYPPISTMLATIDARVCVGAFDAGNIAGADVVVVGNVARPNNVEATYAREHVLAQATLPEVLQRYIFGDARRIVVAGTHGKTTTTGLLVHVFEHAQKQPGYMIGGVPQGKEHGYACGNGAYAVFEGDEYDTSYYNKMPKFLQYGAHVGIVTSIELDHVDIYAHFDDYKQSFHFFAQDIPQDGFLCVYGDAAETRALQKVATAPVYTYGLTAENDFYATNCIQQDGFQQFTIVRGADVLGVIETPLSGLHNVSNIVAVVATAVLHDIPFSSIADAIRTFTGMKRRQEIVSTANDIMVIDDFAHHPTAVTQTLAGLKKAYPDKRMIVLFEPRSNSSRKKVFEEAYGNSFDDADLVWIKVPPFRDGDVTHDVMDAHAVAKRVTERGTPMRVVETVDVLLDEVLPVLQKNDLVVMMSNGSFDGLQQKLVEKISAM